MKTISSSLKLKLQQPTVMQTPNLHYLTLALLLATTINADNDVPGCACQADTTCGTKHLNAEVLYPDSLFPDVLACSLAQRSDPPYRFPDVLDQPLCDGLEADPEFQRAVGNESIPYYINGQGEPYYETGFVAMKIAQGSCEDLIAEQNSCPVATDGSNQDPDEEDEFGSGNSYSRVEPKACTSLGRTLPTTNSTLKVSFACESWNSPDKNITGGYEDGISIHAILGEDLDLCGDDKQAFPPSLTREDWIEPKAGSSRRYMTKEIVDDGTEYCLLVMSIGNEPCRGPQPASSSSRTTNRTLLMVGPLALAFLSWVL